MRFTKPGFFLALAGLWLSPFVAGNLWWLAHSKATQGMMTFMGKRQDGQFFTSYPVIKFTTDGHDTIFFNGTEEAKYRRNESIPIRYNLKHPADARINDFGGIWGNSAFYAAVPFCMLVVAFLHPAIIPRKKKIVIGKNPFLRLE